MPVPSLATFSGWGDFGHLKLSGGQLVIVLALGACPAHRCLWQEGHPALRASRIWARLNEGALQVRSPLLLVSCKCWQEISSWKWAASHWQVIAKASRAALIEMTAASNVLLVRLGSAAAGGEAENPGGWERGSVLLQWCSR